MKILSFITAVKKRGPVRSKDPNEQPRDEHGRWISKQDPTDHHKDQYGPDDYQDPLESFLEGEERLGKADLPPRPAGALAGRIQAQTARQLEASGAHKVSRQYNLDSATPLLLSYKMHSHNPSAQVLRYMIHRAENVDKYDHPDSAARSDADFQMNLDRWRPDHKRALKMSDLHNFVHANPHVIDDLQSHQQALHDHLRATGKVKNINGHETVPLMRTLPNAHVPENIATSYADASHPKGLWGARQFNYHVPLKNVWYSYDLGPKEAVHPRFPAQDEYIVGSHPRMPAQNKDIQKLVPANTHRYGLERKTASTKIELERIAKSLRGLSRQP